MPDNHKSRPGSSRPEPPPVPWAEPDFNLERAEQANRAREARDPEYRGALRRKVGELSTESSAATNPPTKLPGNMKRFKDETENEVGWGYGIVGGVRKPS